MSDSKARQIEHRARTEKKTADAEYNRGMKLIRERGYEAVKGEDAVKYWCWCNGL